MKMQLLSVLWVHQIVNGMELRAICNQCVNHFCHDDACNNGEGSLIGIAINVKRHTVIDVLK